MEVRFTHPQTSDTYLADVSPMLTVQQAFSALRSQDTGPFLPPLPEGQNDTLILRRTGQRLALDMTMGEAGVQDGEVLDVVYLGIPAGGAFSTEKRNPVLRDLFFTTHVLSVTLAKMISLLGSSTLT